MSMRLSIGWGLAAVLGCGGKPGHAPAASGAAAAPGASTAPAGPPASAGCFPSDGHRGFASFTADDRSATLCTNDVGREEAPPLCLAVDFATGAWRGAMDTPAIEPKPRVAPHFEIRQDPSAVSVCKGTACTKLAVPPPKLVDGEPVSYLAAVSADGKRAVVADDSLEGAWFFDATTGKKLRALELVTDDGGCMDNVAFLDAVVYIAVNVCAGPGAEGTFYSWAGKPIGKLEAVNPYGAPPIHLAGTTYAFADLHGSAIEVFDSKTLRTRALAIPETACEDCDVLGASPVGGGASLIKTASGTLVDLVANAVVVVDPAATRIERRYPLPVCEQANEESHVGGDSGGPPRR